MTKMKHEIALFLVLLATGFTASAQAQVDCNPYLNACATAIAAKTQQPAIGPAGPMQPYTSLPPLPGIAPAMVWHLGELFIDDGDNRYGWIILQNLDTRDQIVNIIFTFDNGNNPSHPRAPIQRFVRVDINDPRKSFSLNINDLVGSFYSATVYFAGKGIAHAVFRPEENSTRGTKPVAPEWIPQTTDQKVMQP